jgi:hypothetical protein
MAFLERFGLLLASAIVYSAAHPTKRPNTSTVRFGVVTDPLGRRGTAPLRYLALELNRVQRSFEFEGKTMRPVQKTSQFARLYDQHDHSQQRSEFTQVAYPLLRTFSAE